MSDKKRRLTKLERAANAGEVRVVVCWDEVPPEPEPGVIVVSWDADVPCQPDKR